MLRAEQDGVTPEQLIARMHTEHRRDFAGFHIEFDNYYSTHSDENRDLCYEIFRRLDKAGLIDKRPIERRLLTDAEVEWLNRYHRRVLKALSPALDAPDRRWLKAACAPL